MKMISFELKKYVLKPSVVGFLILFAILNFVKFFEIYFYFGGGRWAVTGTDAISEGFEKLYPVYGGKITSEKIDGLKAELASARKKLDERGTGSVKYDDCYTGYPFGDVELISNTFVSGYEYAIFYRNYADELVAEVNENIEFFNGVNGYEVRKNSLIADCFRGRYVEHYVNPDGWTTLFDYKFSVILVMLMIVLTFSPVFSGERAGGFDKLIISSGKRKTAVRSKLMSAGIFTFASVLMFFLLDILFVAVFHGIDCFEAPVYAIKEYTDCPFTLTLGGAMLLSFFGRLVSMLFFAAAVCFISSFGRNTAVSLFISAVFGAALILLSDILPDSLNPLGLAHIGHFLEEFSVVNLFGVPVFSAAAALLVTLLLTVGLTFAAARRALK